MALYVEGDVFLQLSHFLKDVYKTNVIVLVLTIQLEQQCSSNSRLITFVFWWTHVLITEYIKGLNNVSF